MKETSAGRQLTSQEESILMPLIQGLLSANGCDSPLLMQTKHENTPFGDGDAVNTNAKNGYAGKVETDSSELLVIFSIFFKFRAQFPIENVPFCHYSKSR